jgi:ATP-dependent DNA helicase PIF1
MRQLIICGDFAQLPPIPGRDKQGGQVPALFAFEAQSWEACMGYPVLLQKVFRQKNQGQRRLSSMYVQRADKGSQYLWTCSMQCDLVDSMRARLRPSADSAVRFISTTALILPSCTSPPYRSSMDADCASYPTRREVESANNRRLNALKTETQTYRSHDIPGRTDDGQRVSQEGAARLLEKLIATREITLKVGAQVMLIKNLRQGILVNGTLGKVLAFCTSGHARATQTEISDEQDDQVPFFSPLF